MCKSVEPLLLQPLGIEGEFNAVSVIVKDACGKDQWASGKLFETYHTSPSGGYACEDNL